MSDLLVNLYSHHLDALEQRIDVGASTIRRAVPPETHLILAFVEKHFSPYWVSEVSVAMAHQPPGCFIATIEGRLVGFACYDATARGFFGPTGVDEAFRGRGLGLALLHRSLAALKAEGYAYAVIGAAGPVDFYARAVGATVIPDTGDTLYTGLLRAQDQSDKNDVTP